MEGLQKVAEGLVTGARSDGVKTKNGCENTFLALRGGVVSIIFRKLLGFGPLLFAILPRKKSDYTSTGHP